MTPLVYDHLYVKESWSEHECIVYKVTGVRYLGVKLAWPEPVRIVY